MGLIYFSLHAGFPSELKSILESEVILKVGVGIHKQVTNCFSLMFYDTSYYT